MKKIDLSNIKVDELQAQINKARMDLAARRIKNTNIVKNLKRTLAQVLTYQKLNTKEK